MCVFCDIINHQIPSKVVYEDDDVLAILDIAQVTRGHTIVMPKKHVKNILEADAETAGESIMDLRFSIACATSSLVSTCVFIEMGCSPKPSGYISRSSSGTKKKLFSLVALRRPKPGNTTSFFSLSTCLSSCRKSVRIFSARSSPILFEVE